MIYVISDIHGHFDEFMQILKMIAFNENDQLYVLGDVIDKGNKSIEMLLYVLKQNNIYFTLGNHELMMYQYLKALKDNDKKLINLYEKNWLEYNFGLKTLKQYLALTKDEQDFIFQKLEYCPLCYPNIEANNQIYYLTHSCPYNKDMNRIVNMHMLNENAIMEMVWGRYPNLIKGKILVHGHTITADKRICYGDSIINIDCGCAGEYRMGVLRLDDNKEYYIDLFRENEKKKRIKNLFNRYWKTK